MTRRLANEGILDTVVIGGDSTLLLKELVDLREKDIKRRIHVKNGVRGLEYQWQHATKTQDSFMMACATFMAAVSDRTIDSVQVQSMQEAWRQMQNLSGHIRSRETDLAKSLNDVFHLENRLYVKEHEFYQRLQGIAGTGALVDEDGASLHNMLEEMAGFAIVERATMKRVPDLRSSVEVRAFLPEI